MLKGLKIENNMVLKKNDTSENWERISSSSIPLLEDLLKKLDTITYSNEDKNENIVFENEVNIGQRSIKSTRDENGDIVYTIGKESSSNVPLKINEDLEFEMNDAAAQTTFKNERKLVNFWGKTDRIEESKTELSGNKVFIDTLDNLDGENKRKRMPTASKKANRNSNTIKANNTSAEFEIINQISNMTVNNEYTSFKILEPAPNKPFLQNSLAQSEPLKIPIITNIKLKAPIIEPLKYNFKKRINTQSSFNKRKALQVFLRELSELKNKIESFVPSTMDNRNEISFVRRSRWNSKRRKHGGIVKAIETAKKLAGNKDLFHTIFQLEKISTEVLNDFEFDKIISKTINSNLDN